MDDLVVVNHLLGNYNLMIWCIDSEFSVIHFVIVEGGFNGLLQFQEFQLFVCKWYLDNAI